MTFYGLSSFDRCKKLMLLFKSEGKTEISKDDLAFAIAEHIGSSKFYKTVSNYMTLLQGLKFIVPVGTDKFKLNYDKLEVPKETGGLPA